MFLAFRKATTSKKLSKTTKIFQKVFKEAEFKKTSKAIL